MKMIRNVTVATVDKNDTVIPNAAVVIDGERIAWVGKEENCPYHRSQMEEVTDGLGDLLIPGLVNAHTHTVYFLTRGLGMDRDLKDWLTDAVWPYLAALRPKDVYLGGLLGYGECLKSGVTSVIDNYYASAAAAPDNADALLTAMQDSGIRGVLARGYHDTPFNIPALFAEDGETAAREYDRLLNSWQGANRGRIDLWVSPVNLLYCSPDSIRQVYDVARTEGNGGDDDGGAQIVLSHSLEQKAPENDLLHIACKGGVYCHQDRNGQRCGEGNAVYQIDAGHGDQGQEP